jgi:hypothetical protein
LIRDEKSGAKTRTHAHRRKNDNTVKAAPFFIYFYCFIKKTEQKRQKTACTDGKNDGSRFVPQGFLLRL